MPGPRSYVAGGVSLTMAISEVTVRDSELLAIEEVNIEEVNKAGGVLARAPSSTRAR